MALEAAVFCESRVMYGLWAWGWGYHSLHSLPSEQVVKELLYIMFGFTAVCYPSF